MQAAPAQQNVSVCDRTPEAQTAILSMIAATDCADVTTENLNSITQITVREYSKETFLRSDFYGLTGVTKFKVVNSPALKRVPADAFDELTKNGVTRIDLNSNGIEVLEKGVFDGFTAVEEMQLTASAVKALDKDIFDGLDGLKFLYLHRNMLTTLDEGIFDGLDGLEYLTLSGNGLATLPAGLFDPLGGLITLYLYDNELTALDEDIFDGLDGLKFLYLHRNMLETLDEDIFDGLTSLTRLSLSNNSLTELDEDIFDGLTSLSRLYLNNNSLTGLDEDIFDGGFTYLSTLSLYSNELTALDEDIFDELQYLGSLYLNDNSLAALPEDIFDELQYLRSLYLNDNSLTALPEDIFEGMQRLQHLYLNNNSLATLDEDIFDGLTDLITLDLDENSLTTLDAGVFMDLGRSSFVRLYLRGNGLTALPAGIFNGLTGLQRLDLSCNGLTTLDLGDDTSPFNPFATTLLYLDLDANSFASPAPTETAVRAKLTNSDLVLSLTGESPCFQAYDTGLDDLTVSAGTLRPPFAAPGLSLYQMTVAHDVDVVTITPTARNPHATISPEGNDDANEVDEGIQFELKYGGFDSGNHPAWTVTAEDGSATSTYRMYVTREYPPSPAAEQGELWLSQPALNLDEGGGGGRYGVRLNKRPTADVTVSLSQSASGVADPGPTELTFTDSNWQINQRVHVSPVADSDRLNDAVTLTHRAASADASFDGAVARLFVNVDERSPWDHHLHRIAPRYDLELGHQDLPEEAMQITVGWPFYQTIEVVAEGNRWAPSGIWGDPVTGRVWVVDPIHFGIHPLKLSALREGRIERHAAPDTTTFDYRFNYDCHFSGSVVPGIGNPGLTVIWGDVDTIWVANTERVGLDAYRRDGSHLGDRCHVDNVTAWSSGSPPEATTAEARFKTPFTRNPAMDYVLPAGDAGLADAGLGDVSFFGVWSDGATMWLSLTSERIVTLDLAGGAFAESSEFGQFPAYGLWSDGMTMWTASPGWLRAYDLGTHQRRAEFDVKLRSHSMPPADIWSDGERIWVANRTGYLGAYKLPPRPYEPSNSSQEPKSDEPEALTASFSAVPEAHDGRNEFSLRIAFSEDVRSAPAGLLDGSLDELQVFGATLLEAVRADGRQDLWELTLVPDGRGPVSLLLSPGEGCKGADALCTVDGRPLSGFRALQIPGPQGKSVELQTPLEPGHGPPPAPAQPSGVVIFAGGVDLSWPAATGAEAHAVQTWRSGGWLDLPADGVEIAFYGAGAIISGLDPQSSLWFRLRAANAEGVSAWSPMLLINATSQYELGRRDRPANLPATGAPLIQGTPEPGRTLFAETSSIEDPNGLEQVRFGYQWTADDGGGETEIAGATHLTYVVAAADAGRTLRVRVSFVDRHGYAESLTSAAAGAAPDAVQQRTANRPAAGVPTITGAPQVDETLTAEISAITDADGLEDAVFEYQWLLNDGTADTDIAGATGSSYTLTGRDQGRTIQVRVSFTDDAGNEESLTSPATEEVDFAVQQQTGNTSATGAPVITGTAQVGETLTADTSGIADVDGLNNATFGYQWISNDGTADADITGATNFSLTLVAADEGKTLKVQVSFTDDAGNEETLTSAETAEVAAAAPTEAPSRPGNLTGTANTNGTVTLTWDAPEDASVTGYQILRRRPTEGENKLLVHVDDTGSTATEYTDEDVAPGVSHIYRVKAVNPVGLSKRSNDVRVTPVTTPNSPATGVPTIGGRAQVGETLTANVSGIADADGLTNASHSYQWIRNDGDADSAIQNATGSSYTLVDPDEGNAVKVKVRFTDDAGNEESLTSEATSAVSAVLLQNSPATGAPAITGAVEVGQTLSVGATGIEDDDGLSNVDYVYQWIRVDTDSTETNIPDAAGSTYTLVDADEGKTVKVQVGFTDDAGNEERLISVATAPVAARPNSPATGAPTIGGTAQVGETLTADVSGIADADGLDNAVFSYQWIANDGTSDTDITGATGSTYTLVAADDGRTVKVRVSFSDDAGNNETLTSAATETVSFVVQQQVENSAPTGAPAITGMAQVGEALTADTSGIADSDGLDNAVFGYQWIASDGTTDTDIQYATHVSYKVADADEGNSIKVRVSFTDDADNEETLTSAATARVEARPNSPATGAPAITGTARVGETLTADVSGIADADGLDTEAFSYQWLADGIEITGAASSTYTVKATDLGKTLKVRVSYTDDRGAEESVTSAATEAVAAKPNSPATGAPIIGGTVQVDETLTADVSGIADADGLDTAAFSYQWLADGIEITGAASSTYTLVGSDVGNTIKVQVSFTDDAGNGESLTSAATAAVAAAEPEPEEPPAKPTGLSGTVAHNAVSLSWDDPGDASITSYQILRRNPAVDAPGQFQVYVDDTGSAATTYVDQDVEPDTGYVYRIKARSAAGLSERSNYFRADTPPEPEPEPEPNFPATGLPTILGTTRVGETLTADTSGIGDADGLDTATFGYQWIVSDGGEDLDIPGATEATYTLIPIDADLVVTVRVSFTDDAGNEETLTSAATAVVAAEQ